MSNENIIKLSNSSYFPGDGADAPQEIIDILEKALAMAKSGRVRALAIAYTVEIGNNTPNATMGYHFEGGRFSDLLWAIVELKHTFMNEQNIGRRE